ncbi:hypothetical protein [Thiorhodovibrio frisius]|uniref:Uncharacterized protein n=1 Tax=Thiorhodovibrio frisius TaxID=631362 RepID=H8Z4T1_9GAMM|nr:hypothetical protein [Thiorhodovibrio frisius]EIC20338.1 hypothetical protein Thi970DRAFT_03965 [Thiorhodovibrio frisius]WPL21076.1 hypothetical protein Thiofri_01184 [Thiorhodovibrio frisius]
MVNKTIVSRFTGDPPLDEGVCRKIAGGPLYPVAEVQALLTGLGAQAVRAWTNKCQRDMQKWSLDTDDLCELLQIALQSGRFRGAEWCVQHPNGPWAACDAYSLVRREWIANARKEMGIGYYIKFAIAKTGKLLLVVSCHPWEDRR